MKPFLLLVALLSCAMAAEPINRQALVERHSPHLTEIMPDSPLSVGNGRFCFTVDVTGLQSLQAWYTSKGLPLETLARWAWHSESNIEGYTLSDASAVINSHGRPVNYPVRENSPAGQWLRKNPHDMPLAQIAFCDAHGAALFPQDIQQIDQTLDLWRGEIRSHFTWRGQKVEVSTLAHPNLDGIAVRVRSAALADGSLRISISFPRGHDAKVKNTPPLDWSEPATHRTHVLEQNERGAVLERKRDDFSYGVELAWTQNSRFEATSSVHSFELSAPDGAQQLELCAAFSKERDEKPESWDKTRSAAESSWRSYWMSGAAVDFGGSKDPRGSELERRVVLSQYLMAIQCGGELPPQETGLTCSSWYGKHHTEMVWWHMAHFVQWGRDSATIGALEWFKRVLPEARKTAQERGLEGARWSKMVGPDGRESPGGNPLIVWNQPHPIYLAELLYRAQPSDTVLEEWDEVVFETANCMASMLHFDANKQRYVLGPPLWIAQELYDKENSQNPTYELAYWAYGLNLAQKWRERMRLPRNPAWDECLRKLSPLPQKNGLYVAIESIPDTWDKASSRIDHPSFLMALGQLPGLGVDPETMRRTLKATLNQWDWEAKIWGWDYPMIAMTAARLGESQTAVDILLKDLPNNRYLPNGHCPQRQDLGVYLPANGALLSAVGLMAGGWDGAPTGAAPGFPKDGKWIVRAEGFRKLP